MTIDGADAKDLDDAISVARYRDGQYFLAVHIADVAEYVREWSALDHEAILRTTSIYTPWRVIPMLPEKLSNDLCSLHPGTLKLTLSILMKMDQKGDILGTFMTEGMIESRKRGIYEEIQENDERWTMNDENIFPKKDKKLWNGGSGGEIVGRRKENTLSENDYKQQNGESEGATLSERGWKQKRDERQQSESEFVDPSGAFGTFHSWKVQEDSEDKRFLPEQEWRGGDIPFLDDFFSLFHILERRRKKEGKIIFESSEPTFIFDQEGDVMSVEKRERGASHMMIEEFMVLANEEVAKWCTKYSLPFLSRIHHLPPEENAKIIREIIGLAWSHEKLHPWDIRGFLDRYSLTQMTDNWCSFQDFRVWKYLNDEKLWNGGSGSETVWAKQKKTTNRWAERGWASFLPPETFGTFGHESTEMGSWKEQEDSKGKRFLLSPRGSFLDALHQFTLSQEWRDTGSESSGEWWDMEAWINQEGWDRAGNTYIPSSLYRYSRLLLPKMAKAFYSDKAHMHFGLALEYYSHFTSPIRRYPDLQVHRIIKEQLHGILDKKRKDHYRQILKKIAKKCSDGEARATDIERAVDAIVICRYMADKVGQTFDGRISGLTEWAIFVELESGVEVTSYLPKWRERYTVDPIYGTLSQGKKIFHMIGDPVHVKVVAINSEEKRVEGQII